MISEKITAMWHGSFAGKGHLALSGTDLPLSLSKSYGGACVGVNPDELLASAVLSCFLITYGIVLGKSNVSYSELTGDGYLKKSDELPPQILSINLSVRIRSAVGDDLLQALSKKAKELCVISRAIDSKIALNLTLVSHCEDVLPRTSQPLNEDVL